jgi:hypothetical protein
MIEGWILRLAARFWEGIDGDLLVGDWVVVRVSSRFQWLIDGLK